MKNNEELARIHFNEVIQQGLLAQRIHRTLAERREEQGHQTSSAFAQGIVTLNKMLSQLTVLFNRVWSVIGTRMFPANN